MRHAKSDWTFGTARDFDRPLAQRGRKDAPRMGQWLQQHKLIPDIIISSPAQRTKETIYHVIDQLAIPKTAIVWDERIYEASLNTLLGVIEDHKNSSPTMMLIGHNPGLDALLMYLSADEVPIGKNGKLMTTAAIAVLDYGKNGIETDKNSAKLDVLIRPKELKKNNN